jgi:hypothetical protein
MQPGDLVVCVDDEGQEDNLSAGSVYEVARRYSDDGIDYVSLVGVAEDARPHDGFYTRRFRPVRPTSIEIFRAMLSPSPVREEQHA